MATPDFDAWFSPKAAYDRMEAFWSKPVQAFLETATANQLMGLTREQHLTQSKLVREQFEAFWSTLRLPSLGETARVASMVVDLGEQVEALGDRMGRIEAKLDALAARNATPEPSAAKVEDAPKAKK